MSDQCRTCTERGDLVKCLSAECFSHENWIVRTILARVEELAAEVTLQSTSADMWENRAMSAEDRVEELEGWHKENSESIGNMAEEIVDLRDERQRLSTKCGLMELERDDLKHRLYEEDIREEIRLKHIYDEDYPSWGSDESDT